MGIGVSLLLMAAGAVMAFAIEVEESNGVNLNTIGVILMIVGAIGMLASMAFWSSWGGFRRDRETIVTPTHERRTTIVEDY